MQQQSNNDSDKSLGETFAGLRSRCSTPLLAALQAAQGAECKGLVPTIAERKARKAEQQARAKAKAGRKRRNASKRLNRT